MRVTALGTIVLKKFGHPPISQKVTGNTALKHLLFQYFMDPSMYERKQTEYKGFRSVKFSHPLCTSLTGTELLAVLSLDYRCVQKFVLLFNNALFSLQLKTHKSLI